MAEVRVMREGTLRWVAASGSGNSWSTASAPQSGVFGFVDSFDFASAQTVTTVSDRGTPNHHKVTDATPIDLNVTFKWTGTAPVPASGDGASVPMFHLEYRANEPENAGSGRYYQFYGAAMVNANFTEGMEADTIQQAFRCLAMSGVNNTGYLG